MLELAEHFLLTQKQQVVLCNLLSVQQLHSSFFVIQLVTYVQL